MNLLKFHARRYVEDRSEKKVYIQWKAQGKGTHTPSHKTRPVDSGSTSLITTIIQQNLSADGVFSCAANSGEHMCSRAQKYYFLKLLGKNFDYLESANESTTQEGNIHRVFLV